MGPKQTRLPHNLELVIGFVNTLEPEHGTDEIADPALLRSWLIQCGLVDRSQPALTAAQHKQAITLREAIRALMLVNNGGPDAAGAAAEVGRVAARGALGVRFAPDGSVSLSPQAGGFKGALAGILVPFCLASLDGKWQRAKACREPACQEAFFDHSRNRSAVWCDMALCGNRMKVRSYRARARG